VEALQAARKRQSRFALAALSPAARRVLELGRLDRVFSIYESSEAGLDDLD
jgi:anti-anti-sigma regulatory factor